MIFIFLPNSWINILQEWWFHIFCQGLNMYIYTEQFFCLEVSSKSVFGLYGQWFSLPLNGKLKKKIPERSSSPLCWRREKRREMYETQPDFLMTLTTALVLGQGSTHTDTQPVIYQRAKREMLYLKHWRA